MDEKLQPRKLIEDYPKLFNSNLSKRAAIMAAVTRLGLTMNQPIEAAQLPVWADQLEKFSPQQLTAAFTRTACTVEAWPTPAIVENMILDGEFGEDITWLIANLRIHGIEWKNKEARTWTGKYDPETATWEKISSPHVPAPEIPRRLVRCLEAYGRGTVQDGLERFAAHPALHPGLYETETKKQLAWERIEEEFKDMWVRARLAHD